MDLPPVSDTFVEAVGYFTCLVQSDHGPSNPQFRLKNPAIGDTPEDLSDEATIMRMLDVTKDWRWPSFITHQNATMQRPVKALEGFSKVDVSKGETKAVRIQLDKKYLCMKFLELKRRLLETRARDTTLV
ncbi:uncharacterized protein F4807DRAFT_462535 [Annulohypoxylon truncatum]|uniref:uncharacterized protein n=1 Tax=Annulohypoxylon truncatum TaxID=327061 RepID=UPI002008E2A6|nr:uncharacterized protein F4807DRAFT_462535 [Annulohypoxylon truncatum]KAI1207735.1 hypothetical protein F4807DRAFT_462535 [Annulohypoxylon truncatum]